MAIVPVLMGVADHNRWAPLVCVSLKDGSPEVVVRRRVELIEPGLPKQPYEHETAGMNTVEAERLVQEVRDSAVHCAKRRPSKRFSRKSCSFITFCFYVLSLEYPQARSSSI